MLVRAHVKDRGCIITLVQGSAPGAAQLVASVGAGGVNRAEDVLTVQSLLNGISPVRGGPAPPLAEDGLVGPKTTGAIVGYQREQVRIVDGRVDPGGPTITSLRKNSSPGQRALALAFSVDPFAIPSAAGHGATAPAVATLMRRAARLKRVQISMPALKHNVRRGLDTVERAIRFFDQGLDLAGGGERSFRLVDHYFALKPLPRARASAALSSIRTAFSRVRTVAFSRPGATGGNLFGEAIFEADPLDVGHAAFSPRERDDAVRNDGLSSRHVYLGNGIDGLNQDLFVHVLGHELFHFVDDETDAREIVDADKGYNAGALKIPHESRMHNADNFALLATHAGIGRTRLLASDPKLVPVTPQDL